MSDENQKSTESWKITSDRADAIHYILATVDCPKDVRNLIDLLVGISQGNTECEATQKEIATRIRQAKIKPLDENAQNQVKRMHRKLRDWQKDNELNLIEYEQGYTNKDKTVTRKSRYYLHILPIADEVIALAQKNPRWHHDRAKVLARSAKELQDTFAPVDILYHRDRSKKMSWDKELSKNLRSSISYMRKANQVLKDNKGSIAVERELIEEFENTLKELKKRQLHNILLSNEDLE